jgi:hypothetical protein
MEMLDTARAFLQNILVEAKGLFAAMPQEIVIFAFILGFFCAAASLSKKTFRLPGLLIDILRASSVLAFLVTVAMGAYVFLLIGHMELAFYIGGLFCGMLICAILRVVLGLLGWLGLLPFLFLHLVSGPVCIFTAWFFYQGRLLLEIIDLLD